MRIEVLPDTTNVIRFPIELRQPATMDVLREAAPDCREALNLADVFGLEAPVHDLRDCADAETAGFIALQAPPEPEARAGMLKAMEESAIGTALRACRQAQTARRAAAAANEALAAAESGVGHFWLDGLQQKADAMAEQAAILLLKAHAACEEAEGAARAISFARRGHVWFPRNHQDETDALIAAGATRAG